MYVGRFVVVSPTVAAYRVSSRSFPNRRIAEREPGVLTVGPTPDAPPTDNPYVAYNCLRTVGVGETAVGGVGADDATDAAVAAGGTSGTGAAGAAVLGNGSHVDPIAEKLETGYPARDALAEILLALDYEKDDYDTPRLAGVLDGTAAHVGIVRRDALLVERVDAPTLVATYERDAPGSVEFGAADAAAVAREAYEMDFEHAVCACGVSVGASGVETAIVNGER